MRRFWFCISIAWTAVIAWGADKPVVVREDRFAGVGRWTPGPAVCDLGGVAEIQVPRGFAFLGGEQARRYLSNSRYVPSGHEVGLVARAGTGWYAVFEYEASGHITDDDWDTFDGEALLLAIRQKANVGNWERRRRGWPASKVNGWVVMPHYDPLTHRLDWALDGYWAGQAGIQYNSEFLGRTGVVRMSLIANPARLSTVVPEYRELLRGFRFRPGFAYGDYRSGEPVARGGLTRLLVGPTAVVAVRSGVLMLPWTAIVIIAAIVVALGILRLLNRRPPPPLPIRPWYLR